MQLTFLGTAASNANPEPFCACAHCEQARALGGPSLRKCSSALINDDLLIDLGPDVLVASQQHGRPLTGVRWCLQTHAHSDHLHTGHFYSRSPVHEVVGAPRLHFYASAGSLERAAYMLMPDTAPRSLLDPDVAERLNLTLHTVAAGQAFEAGPYQVVAFTANHDPEVEPLLYAIERDGRQIFYGTDTGPLPEATWQGFHDHRLQFDVVVLDHTYGLAGPRPQHMCADDFIATLARMRAENVLSPTPASSPRTSLIPATRRTPCWWILPCRMAMRLRTMG